MRVHAHRGTYLCTLCMHTPRKDTAKHLCALTHMHRQGHSRTRTQFIRTRTPASARPCARYACRPTDEDTHSHTCAHTHTHPRESPQHLHPRCAVPRVRSPSRELPRRRIAAGLSSRQDTRTCPRGDRRTSCPHALPCLLAPFWLPAIPGTLQPPRGAVQSTKTPQPGRCSQQHGPPGDFAEENHAETLPGPRRRLAPLCTKPSRGAGLRPPPASLLPQPGGGQRATPQLRFPS